jgi:hypothetical protein
VTRTPNMWGYRIAILYPRESLLWVPSLILELDSADLKKALDGVYNAKQINSLTTEISPDRGTGLGDAGVLIRQNWDCPASIVEDFCTAHYSSKVIFVLANNTLL